MFLLAAAYFFTQMSGTPVVYAGTPAVLDMPRAAAFIVRENGRARLEDRYDRMDLWVSRTVMGCWCDDDGRAFTLSRLTDRPPAIAPDETDTRGEYVRGLKPFSRRKMISPSGVPSASFAQALAELSPCGIAEEPGRPRQMPRGFKDLDYWQGTNTAAIVCAFLPEKSEQWYVATWELAEEDDIDEMTGTFEDEFFPFFAKWLATYEAANAPADGRKRKSKDKDGKDKADAAIPSERELHRADVRHSVAAYPEWHVTDADEFVVIDHLLTGSSFVSTLTNELPVLRAQYAAAVPSPIDSSNALCVARIYRDRIEYLSATDEDLSWTAAYWSQRRRELVAYLPDGGPTELMKTIRHEAFHQYLSYACSMIASSPWLNEGYAQYFEDTECEKWKDGFSRTPEEIESMAKLIPGLLTMDYDEFYAGSDRLRRLKYHLAWTIAVFIEKGAPKVRHEPFKDLKRDYIACLLKTHDMHQATEAAFVNQDNLNRFVAEWVRFWKTR